MATSTDVHVSTFDTPAPLYAQLVRLFGEQSNNGTSWVTFTADGIRLSFFAPRDKGEGE